MSDVNGGKKVVDPTWLELHADRVVITLTAASKINGVEVAKVTMRSPTLREVRKCQEANKGDDAKVELMLFASLIEAGAADVEGLRLKDYLRLQAGYFRLGEEDEL